MKVNNEVKIRSLKIRIKLANIKLIKKKGIIEQYQKLAKAV